MKRLLALLLFSLALPACQDALAQVVRPQATPRAAATARPTATLGRIPEAVSSTLPAGAVIDLRADATSVFSGTDGTGAIANGGTVGSWDDAITTNSFLYVVNSAPRPVYNESQINGLPAITFNNADGSTFRYAIGTDILTTTDEVTMAAVVKHTSTGPVLSQDEGGGGADKWFFAAGAFGVRGLHINGVAGSDVMTGGFTNDSTWHVVLFRRKADGTWTFRRDGAQTESGTTTTDFSTPNTGFIEIAGAEGSVMSGQIARVVLYNSALSDADYSLLETELKSIYAL